MEAIILARQNVREYDQHISLLTKEHGKQDVLIRGVKKITSKNSAHLEPGVMSDVELAEGKESMILTKATTIELFGSIRTNIKKNIIAATILQITTALLHPFDVDNAHIYTLVHKALYRLNETPTPSLLFIDTFVARLLAALGFLPVLSSCVVSEKTSDLTHFAPAAGGMIHKDVAYIKKQHKEAIIPVSAEARSYVEYLWSEGWNDIAHIPTEHHSTIHRVVIEFLRFHQEKEIADWFVYSKLLRSL